MGYTEEEKIVYLGNYDKHMSFEELEEFMSKFGKILNFNR